LTEVVEVVEENGYKEEEEIKKLEVIMNIG
jgi:hypothetical protein